jgi:hypothetical protein
MLRGYSVYEHEANLDYAIVLDKNNAYYDTFKGSDVENTEVEFKTDENGFLLPSYQSGGKKLFFLGDSTIESTFVNPYKRYPYLVGQLLNKRGVKVDTYNCGVSGGDTLSLCKTLIMKLLPMKPSAIVFCNLDRELLFLLSDVDFYVGANSGKKRIVYDYSCGGRKQRLKNAIRIIIGTKTISEEIKSEGGKLDSLSILDTVEKDLDLLLSICQARNVKLFLMTQANSYQLFDERIKRLYDERMRSITNISYEEYVDIYRRANDQIRMFCRKKNIVCIDMEEKVPAHLLYDSVHYSNEGSCVAAGIIEDYLYEEGIRNENK